MAIANGKITLEKFYSEFVKFVKGTEKRFTGLEKGQDGLARDLNRIENKIDKTSDFLDREVLDNRRGIKRLENIVAE